ncbi:hypothetical protein KQX54_009274 [Cotesia glomerata]|uniref:Uncharacterized protein n=1 Tax=Cotesia glomerata TaxID=32391 RepID=A0AAV7J1R8_COTGL|nr:hypothetical protein KQX54_009274 [Cotesia glomerata]
MSHSVSVSSWLYFPFPVPFPRSSVAIPRIESNHVSFFADSVESSNPQCDNFFRANHENAFLSPPFIHFPFLPNRDCNVGIEKSFYLVYNCKTRWPGNDNPIRRIESSRTLCENYFWCHYTAPPVGSVL